MWLTPLDTVGRAVAGHPRAPFFDLSDFMIMDGILRRSWLLPWMKPGLEHERRDLEFDDAWRLDPRDAA